MKRRCLLTSGKGLIGRKARFGGVSPWKSYQAQVSEQRAPCQGSPPKRRRLPACPRVTTLGGGCGRLGVQRARAVTKASATAQKRHRLPVTSVLSQRTLPGPAGRVPGPWARPPPQRRAGGARAAEPGEPGLPRAGEGPGSPAERPLGAGRGSGRRQWKSELKDLPMTSRRTSLVPAPISYSLASRRKRPMGKSLM